ncbi:MAG: hypothetical protein NZM04_08800 [Methylacidiphilales bacterium]|nr:hypothetical protein [Candidatus Methylacidiphilales bacterium]MDW8349808.1 hypothetical protein [Verrucomicrobiae bacterium]
MLQDSPVGSVFAETPCERRAIHLFREHYEKAAQELGKTPYAIPVIERRDGTHLLGKNSVMPRSDRCYVFDLHTLKFLSCAILDLAKKVDQGRIIGVWQDFDYYREEDARFKALAQTFESIRVWGCGQTPSRRKRVDFCQTQDPRILKYWITLFRSAGCRAVLIARQINKTSDPAKKRFVGFYTFNPYMVKWIAWRFNLCCCGIGKLFDQWEDELHLPQIKMSELRAIEKGQRF